MRAAVPASGRRAVLRRERGDHGQYEPATTLDRRAKEQLDRKQIMRISSKLLLAALTATLVLALAAGTVAANRSIAVAPGGAILAISLSLLTFTGLDSGAQITSRVTLHGSVVRSAAKREGTHIGSITACLISEPKISVGSVVIRCDLRREPEVHGLPWLITYLSFNGTLPNITGLNIEIRLVAFLFEIRNTVFFDGLCLYAGNIRATTNGPTITRIEIVREARVPLLIRLSGFCDRAGTLTGGFTIAEQRLTLL